MSEGAPPDEVVKAAGALDVALGADPDTVRRAYLRKVKVHKPEVDPAGFKRVREAFEILGAWTAFQAKAQRRAAERASEPESAERAAVDATPEPPDVPEAPAVPVAPAAADAAPEPSDVAETPAAPIVSAPAAPVSRWREAWQLMAAKQHDDARAVMVRLFQGEEALGPAPHPVQLLFVLLEMQVATPGKSARQTMQAFQHWLDRTQQELALRDEGPRWLLTRELARVTDNFPGDLEGMIAGGILTGDFDTLTDRIRAYTRATPERADGAILDLADRAPSLHQMLSPWLNADVVKRWDEHGGKEPPEPPKQIVAPGAGRAPQGGTRAWPWGLTLPAVFVLLRLCSSLDTSSVPQHSYTSSYAPPVEAAQVDVSPLSPVLMPADVATEVCAKAPDSCLDAQKLAAAYMKKDCAAGRSAILSLEQRVPDAQLHHDTRAASALNTAIGFYRTFTDHCP